MKECARTIYLLLCRCYASCPTSTRY